MTTSSRLPELPDDLLKRALTFYNRGEGLTRADILNMAITIERCGAHNAHFVKPEQDE